MVINNGDAEGLFRAAFMNSGSQFPLGPLENGKFINRCSRTMPDGSLGQLFFDKFAADTGCADSLGSPAVFDCLRKVPIDTIRVAINNSVDFFTYQAGFSYSYKSCYSNGGESSLFISHGLLE
jgi:hypothetical protein